MFPAVLFPAARASSRRACVRCSARNSSTCQSGMLATSLMTAGPSGMCAPTVSWLLSRTRSRRPTQPGTGVLVSREAEGFSTDAGARTRPLRTRTAVGPRRFGAPKPLRRADGGSAPSWLTVGTGALLTLSIREPAAAVHQVPPGCSGPPEPRPAAVPTAAGRLRESSDPGASRRRTHPQQEVQPPATPNYHNPSSHETPEDAAITGGDWTECPPRPSKEAV